MKGERPATLRTLRLLSLQQIRNASRKVISPSATFSAPSRNRNCMADRTPSRILPSRKGDLLFTFVSVAIDALAIEGAFLLSYWTRFKTNLFDYLGYIDEAAPPLSSYVLASLFVMTLWLILFQSQRMYGA